jgi:Domain of unknown function (DUF4806)
VSKEHRFNFPIDSHAELLRMNNLAKKKDTVATYLVRFDWTQKTKLFEQMNLQIEFFRKYKPITLNDPLNNRKYGGIHHIMTDDLINDYNWNGNHNKKSLKDLHLISYVVYGESFAILLSIGFLRWDEKQTLLGFENLMICR